MAKNKYTKLMNRLYEHLSSVKAAYPNIEIFALILQGSQNYGIDDIESDVDSKALVIPCLDELVLNRAPISKTFVLENNEHCDLKDVREYFKILRKSNINFVEVLFSEYVIINPFYMDYWKKLVSKKEEIARINPYRAVKAMAGMAHEKYHALTHKYPSRMEYINKYGFDPKQLSHLVRINEFLHSYLNDMPYEDCIKSPDYDTRKLLHDIKRNTVGYNGKKGLTLEEAQEVADFYMNEIDNLAKNFCDNHKDYENETINQFLDSILYDVITTRIKKELGV